MLGGGLISRMICKSGYYYVYYASLEIVLEESEFLRFLLRKIVCELSVGLEVVKLCGKNVGLSVGVTVVRLCGKSIELSVGLEVVIDELLWKKRRVECGVGGCN